MSVFWAIGRITVICFSVLGLIALFVFLFECRNIELITIADYKKKNVVFVCPLANVIVSFTEFYSVQIRII